jgi:diguanylate cyclase (GGDEF)-like protein
MSYRFDTARRDQENHRLIVEAALREQQLIALKRARQWQWLAMALGGLLLLMLVGLVFRQFRRAGRMYRLAMTDALTGVANRRWIQDIAGHAVRQARLADQPLAMLVFDIDHFKRINDAHGHQVGDQVLVRVVHACQAGLRQVDRLGRIGGEEFLAILPGIDLDGGRHIAERLRGQVNALDLEDIAPGLKVSISLGVAALGGVAEGLEALVQQADRALYRAKASGRNRVEGAVA